MNPTVIERKWCLQKETKQQSKAAKETVRLASLTDDTSWHGSFQVRKHSGEQDRPGTHPHDPKPQLSPNLTVVSLFSFKPVNPKTAI